MSTRGGLGHFAGYHTRIPVYVPGALHGKKPCRSTSGAAFVPVQNLVLEQQKPARPDPLYLFQCGLNWNRFGDTSSGWELLQAMRAKDRGARPSCRIPCGNRKRAAAGPRSEANSRRIKANCERCGAVGRRTSFERGDDEHAVRVADGGKLHHLSVAQGRLVLPAFIRGVALV